MNLSPIESLNRLKRQIQIVCLNATCDPQVVERTALERPRILAALEARDAELAAQLMEEHIEGVRCSIIAQMAVSTNLKLPALLILVFVRKEGRD
jgi:DNA-binding GntR family transcriptional regulator